jgi:hypothetical protein
VGPMRRRILAAGCLLAVAVATAGALFSERAPGLYRRLSDRGVVELARLLEWAGVEHPDRSAIPFTRYLYGHVALFCVLTVVATVVLRRRARPVVVALAVFALSAAVELLQPVVTATRTQHVDDLVANGVGVLLGFVVASVLVRIGPLRRARTLAW